MAERHLPVFVYGTLRVGGRFHDDVVGGRFAQVRPAHLPGVVMWDNGGAYPFVAPVEGAAGVTGELLGFPDATFAAVLADLDRLEGYEPGRTGNLYERVVIDVETAAGIEPAWVYLRGAGAVDELDATLPRVASGDWFDRPDSSP